MAESGEEKVDVVIAFDFDNPKRQDKTESMPVSEAYALVNTGRARWPEKSPQAKQQAAAEQAGTL